MLPLLKKNHVFKLDDLCLSMRNDLAKMIHINEDFILNDDDLDFDSESDEETNNDSSTLDVDSEGEDEDRETETENTKSTKDGYERMRIYSTKADKDKNKFFKIEISGKEKYIHKQTAI
ncbi:unnamed protein product [Adineta steineri]|uniref:Uncharacterized protein n=1 Tax=Adineta steineri TaxID=433720 RepID=A0A815JC48_9BILA|nr:unnamed protein product [Adineta steineri]CAF1533323.1 unnamed protein product [Adineta steineri]CAF1607362.1 unnamed protein product [Adineta steineri]CAF1654501.1 unnamed protein product [Adineta steineri]